MYSEVKLLNELMRDEDLRFNAYEDTQGLWTIGIGHLLGHIQRMSSINYNEIISLYNGDIKIALVIVRSCIPKFDTLDDVRQRALINMAFNRGENMKTSSTITPAINKAVDTGDWEPLEVAINTSQWAQQVGNRATRLLYMLTTGKVQ